MSIGEYSLLFSGWMVDNRIRPFGSAAVMFFDDAAQQKNFSPPYLPPSLSLVVSICSGYPYGGNSGCRANTPDRASSLSFNPPSPLSTQVSFSETLSTLATPESASDGNVLAPAYEVEADYICESSFLCAVDGCAGGCELVS